MAAQALARGMAQAMMDGFNRHYQLFRQESARGKHRFETCDWHGQQRAQRERIEFYDLRVRECQKRLEREFAAGSQPMAVWHQTKLDYIALLVPHAQPELAETFFNSVSTKILHRSYFNNDFLFVRPAISTEYMESDMPGAKPTFSAFYPAPDGLAATLARIIESFELRCHFEDLPRDARRVAGVLERELGVARRHTNLQLQVLGSLFYRNKGAYVVGKLVNGYTELPFALPILHRTPGTVFVDAVLHGEQDLSMLFSFSRAYFMVDMEIPSAYVRFLAELMPRKPRAEIYNALGLGKQGKNLFYRELLWHLRHSSDRFRIAPGIRGMVMLVFDLPSYPYVFKIIKDEFAPPKEITREQVRRKYQLVKRHDRVGRMADTMEFSQLAFPRARLDEALIEEIERLAPSQIEHTEDEHGRAQIVIRHAYIERRMIPLNIWLHEALQADPDDPDAQARLEHAVLEYGKAIKDLVAANIFPGDMLWKNFGVTRHAKVVFYDYDEIEYLTDCHFRHVPAPRTEEDEMSGEIWYSVAKNDVFPETFGPFLLGHPRVREQFMRHHAELLTPEFWQEHQQRIRAGEVMDVFPYDRGRRFDPLEPAGNPG